MAKIYYKNGELEHNQKVFKTAPLTEWNQGEWKNIKLKLKYHQNSYFTKNNRFVSCTEILFYYLFIFISIFIMLLVLIFVMMKTKWIKVISDLNCFCVVYNKTFSWSFKNIVKIGFSHLSNRSVISV